MPRLANLTQQRKHNCNCDIYWASSNTSEELELQKEILIDQLTQLKLQEIQVGKEIQEKYGEGAINISKGEFTSSN